MDEKLYKSEKNIISPKRKVCSVIAQSKSADFPISLKSTTAQLCRQQHILFSSLSFFLF